MGFDKIFLKPISWSILSSLYILDKPVKADELAEQCQLTTRQVDAAVTKSLVRYGFCIRQAKLTRLLKKEYNEILITPKGKRYIEWYNANRLTKDNGES